MTTIIPYKPAIDRKARLAEDVQVGPFCVIGPDVTIGKGTKLENNVTITGRVTIGENNRLYPGVVIGGEPQDLGFRGGDTRVVIGDGNVFREAVTVNRATEKEDGVTSIGSHCYFMTGSHVAHDCRVGDYVVMSNVTALGGHVHVYDHATLSAHVGVHHFATVGAYSFVGGLSAVRHDVPPYVLTDGNPSRPRCINVVALKRNDFSPQSITALAEAFRVIFRGKVGLDHAREILRAGDHLVPHVNHLLSFLQTQQEGRHGRARESRRAA